MDVYKRYRGKRVKHGHKDYDKGTWYVTKRIRGKLINRSIPEATSLKDAKRLAERIIARGTGKDLTFAEFADTIYKRYVEQHNKDIVGKSIFIERLKKFFGKHYLFDITAQLCRDYRDIRLKTPAKTGKLSPSSVNREMSTLSKMFSLACEEGILNDSPMRWVKKLREPQPRRRLLTDEQKDALWEALQDDPLVYRYALLGINLPFRIGQLLAIEPGDVNFEAGLVYGKESKGKQGRIVPLNETATIALTEMIRNGHLPSPITYSRFGKRWRDVLLKAGINKEGGTREENFHFHDLRHIFGTELKRRGVDAYHIQQLFAHSDMETSAIYISPEMENLRRAVRTLDIQEIDSIN